MIIDLLKFITVWAVGCGAIMGLAAINKASNRRTPGAAAVITNVLVDNSKALLLVGGAFTLLYLIVLSVDSKFLDWTLFGIAALFAGIRLLDLFGNTKQMLSSPTHGVVYYALSNSVRAICQVLLALMIYLSCAQ